MMPALLDLTLRGSLVLTALLLLEFALERRMRARSRRAWWWLAALAFLIPLQLPFVPHLPGTLDTARQALSLAAKAGLHVPDAAPSTTSWVRTFSLGAILPLLWAAGAAGTLGVVAARTWRTQRRWSRERLSTDSALLALLEDSKAAAGITAPIGLVVTDSVAAPALLGWLRPRILLPSAVAAGHSRETLRAIFLHELAHFRAMDLALHWLLTLVRAVHWFNPLAHVLVARWLHFRELAADEAALDWLPSERRPGYGEVLIAALEQAPAHPSPSGALALGESFQNLKHRLAMIARHASLARRPLLACLVAFSFAALMLLQSAGADQPVDQKGVVTAAITAWLDDVDGGRYEKSWRDAGELFRKQVTSAQWQTQVKAVKDQVGACKSRLLKSYSEQEALPGGLKGEFVIAQFASSFENLTNAKESVTFVKEADGQWRSIGYFVTPAESK